MNDVRGLLEEGTATFLRAVESLPDDAWDGPSRLPDWRPREVVAHVHHNALALRNLVAWARTGVETPMYTSAEQRDHDIRTTATEPVAVLRTLVQESAQALDEDLDGLDDDQWQAEVRTARGRTVRATAIPWLRTREVAVHAVDLGAGLRFDDLSDDLNRALVEDVVAFRLGRGEAATLAAWLTGRQDGAALGPWL
ncbi:maleylpyruvate isomerase N-terminal domain-containing protein [Egicoccus sp. AB-alg2]|uniref:maleylpyruvate isomerase N-terminal domain-containing protein n=1 Tax=Egicoccus sp. AB-alg2 TaxID=3242693 RepID=UPI00359CC355